MTFISPDLLSSASRLFGLRESPVFFAKSHQHSPGTIWQSGDVLFKLIKAKDSSDHDRLDERFRYAAFLHSQGLLCQNFILSYNHRYLELLDSPLGTYMICAWRKIDAPKPCDLHPRALRVFYEDWATLLAKTHQLSQNYQREKPIDWHVEWQDCYASLPDEELKGCFSNLKTELEMRKQDSHNYGYIHNDAHPKNVLQAEAGLHLIDFDRSCRHFFAQDIANAIYSEYSRIAFHSVHKEALSLLPELFLKPFINSYRKWEDYPADDLCDIEVFLYYRQFIMFGVFYQELKQYAPAYLESFRQRLLRRDYFLEAKARALLA